MNAADLVAGRIGSGLDFDEVDDLLRIPDSTSLDSGRQCDPELWIWFDDAADGDSQLIMSSSKRYWRLPGTNGDRRVAAIISFIRTPPHRAATTTWARTYLSISNGTTSRRQWISQQRI
ncbi:MAG: hypothetical protein R3E68_02495 [Burkholderiaceae bacterium]